MKLSIRVSSIEESATLSIDAKAKQLRKEGHDIIGFGAGEPDFDTPDNVKEEGIRAIRNGFTKYTPVPGIPELREAIAEKLKEENGLAYTAAEILVSCGAKHSLANCFTALLDPGDEVVIPAPYWGTYAEQVKLVDGKTVLVPTKEKSGFKIAAAALEKAITPKTKVFVLNSPCNPTGAVYSAEELEALAKVLVARGIVCISDEIYEKINYTGRPHASIARVSKEMKDLTILVNGHSKTYAMTGWRIGWAAGPKAVIAAMTRVQSQTTSNPNSMSQLAAVEALRGDQSSLERNLEEFRRRRDFVCARLDEMGMRAIVPDGAFYVFPDISAWIGKEIAGTKVAGSISFAAVMLEKAGVALVPGEAFGLDTHVRLSYATSMEQIEKGTKRMEEVLR